MRRTSRRFGQHFLERAWVQKVIDVVAPAADQRVLEIGPGRGALTLKLAPLVRDVTAVEIDPRLAESLGRRIPTNVTLIRADFLTLSPGAIPGATEGVRVVGNLPYGVASPILVRLLRLSGGGDRFADATVMLQREVARRVTAGPGESDWGPLAVATRLHGEARIALKLPPGAFRPMPKVHSAIVHVRFRPPPVSLPDPGLFDSLVRALFTQRRKTVANAVRAFATQTSRLPVPELLRQASIDPSRRPGELDLMELAELSAVLARSPR